ncbi:MAG: VOC family protein [Archaeoglobaceae archaeon]
MEDLRIDQIGVVTRDIDKLTRFFREKFGVDFVIFETQQQKGRLKIALTNLGEVQLELIQVLEGETIHAEFLKRKGEGLHHIGFFVKNLDEKLRITKENGMEVVEQGEIAGVRYAYLDTEKDIGLTLEFIEA